MSGGAWTLLDQVLITGVNFLLNILLARWLPAASYGAFTVAFTVFILIGMLHTGLLTEPLLVFGPSRYKKRLPIYYATLLRAHLQFSVVCLIGLGLAGGVFYLNNQTELGIVFFALALALPCVLFLWLIRKACYVRLNIRWAAWGAGMYFVTVLAGLGLLYQQSVLTGATAWGLMAAGSLVAGLWMMRKLGINPQMALDPTWTAFVRRRHWAYGRWASSTGVLHWIPGQVAFILLPLWHGLEASAGLKALMNLIMPAMQAYAALTLPMLPLLVQARREGRLSRMTLAFVGGISGAMVLYLILLGVFGDPLMHLLYRGQYDSYAPLIVLVGLVPLFTGAMAVLAAALRACEQPQDVFWAYVGSAVISLTVGLALMYSLGVRGAILGYIAASIVGLMVLVLYFLRSRSRQHPPPKASDLIST